MFNADWGYDPFQQSKTPAYWKLDKPTLIGESPAAAGKYTMKQMIDSAFMHGYAGIMPWSYNANDGVGTWDDCKTEIKAFHSAHSSLIDFGCGENFTKDSSIIRHPMHGAQLKYLALKETLCGFILKMPSSLYLEWETAYIIAKYSTSPIASSFPQNCFSSAMLN
jgi:hypothetical protein